jgi:hypothetical protein
MAITRLSISLQPDVAERLREHAARAGLDLSTYVAIAVQSQMDQQDRVRETLEPFYRAQEEAETAAEDGHWLGDEIEPNDAEQAEVDAILGLPPRSGGAAA